MDIYDIEGNLIPEIWKAEFRGLFMGEGCMWLGRTWRALKTHSEPKLTHKSTTATGYYVYRVEAKVSLRCDDVAVIRELHRVLGGQIGFQKRNLTYDRPNSKDTVHWNVVSKVDCQRVADILSETNLPAKKMRELPLWKEAISIRKPKGSKLSETERARLDELIQEIHSIRIFKELT